MVQASYLDSPFQVSLFMFTSCGYGMKNNFFFFFSLHCLQSNIRACSRGRVRQAVLRQQKNYKIVKISRAGFGSSRKLRSELAAKFEITISGSAHKKSFERKSNIKNSQISAFLVFITRLYSLFMPLLQLLLLVRLCEEIKRIFKGNRWL